MTNQKILIATVVFFIYSKPAFSDERGKAGLQLNIETNGFFNRTIQSATVESVLEDSGAKIAGIQKGEKIVKIGGCTIPGCKVSLAKKLMNKAPGESVRFTVQNESGDIYTVKIKLQ